MLVAVASCSDPDPTSEPRADTAASRAPLAVSGASTPALATAATTPITGSITLLTGDRVVLTQMDGRVIPQVRPGPGREKIKFSIQMRGDHTTVIPQDVAAAISDGRLDPSLFDATRLLAEGDGDDRRSDLPLIITGQPDLPARLHAMAATGGAGVAIDRTLPALHATIARQDKAHAGATLALIAGAGPALANRADSATRIWLDGHRRVLLDRNVTQIGAPAAYARGFTGAGVTIAVLDTGIDAAHPDLAGKIIAAEDFVGDGNGPGDAFGHGTHVASIAAGTGAASGGEFQGVAPDAQLINARVCDAGGQCSDSALLAGMEWAVATQHARIINMSLGGTDTPDIDPLEDAVNQFSAEFGTLFVIAAGNAGTPQSIESPGSADAALTVGAVDSTDERARFSSSGPRVGDHAVKPDITAPGVDITAARAAGTALGPTVGDQYVILSGTSMATPHVAGSAALLLQQHPDWSGEQLKAALMASAQPTADLTVYDQGAGRVDVDRATRQVIAAEPPSVSFGIAAFPHDDDLPITRTVTYHNPGTDPVVLSLAATLSTSGTAAADGMISISPATVTVPAGGTADVAVTVDTRLGRDGLYGGDLIATAGDVRVIAPLGVEREVESHDLTIALVGLDGEPADAVILNIDSVGTDAVHILQFVSRQAVFRLPVGTYSIGSVDLLGDTWLVAPRFALSADASLTLDGRDARRVDITIPGTQDLQPFATSWAVTDHGLGSTTFLPGDATTATAEIGASAAPGEISSSVSASFGSSADQPSDVYFLAHVVPDHVPTGWRETIQPGDMATSTTSYAGASDTAFSEAAFPILPSNQSAASVSVDSIGRVRRTEHFFSPGTRWWIVLNAGLAIEDAVRELLPGPNAAEAWNRAPFSPAFAGPTGFGSAPGGTAAPVRSGDTITLLPGLYTSQSVPTRHGGTLLGDAQVTLLRDGVAIAESTSAFFASISASVPPEPAQYRLEAELALPPDLFDLSTQVSASWTFRSQHADGVAFLPLPTLRFAPDLDERNQTSARVLALPIRIERSAGAPRPRIARAEVEASFDDGAHWLPVPIVRVGDQALGLIIHPPGTRFVSLRGNTADVDGNQSDLTIIRAYGLAPR